jgi:hypothetical protein
MKAYQQLQELYHRVTLRAWEMAFSPDDDEFNAGEGDENEAGE